MLRNYFRIAYRNLLNHKFYSLINILGLAFGISTCLLILQFVNFEFSYDKFHSKADRIFRVIHTKYHQGNRIQHGTTTFPAIGPAMAKDYEEIETTTQILVPHGETFVKVDNRSFLGDYSFFADENFFSVFDFPMLAGEMVSPLKDKHTVVLTERIARKYFGPVDLTEIIGKELFWGVEREPYTIQGICKNVPENSHIQFDMLLSFSTLSNTENESWTRANARHYLLLKPGMDHTVLESKLEAFVKHHFQRDKGSEDIDKLHLQPLKEVHLYSDYEYEYAITSSGKAVWAMVIVAGFIFVIAWINYINLTTSRSLERAREVGIRKVMGAVRSQLVRQFISEFIVVAALALFAAVIIVLVVQAPFNQLIERDLSIWQTFSFIDFYTAIILIIAVVGGMLLSGFYPAFILSSYQPATILKGKFTRSAKGQFLRKVLVIFQFTASGALITATLIVSEQMSYMKKIDLGINIDSTVVVAPPMRSSFDSAYIHRVRAFKDLLRQLPQVTNVATSSHVPGSRPYKTSGIQFIAGGTSTPQTMNQLVVDEDFLKMFEVKLLAGRMFESSDCSFDWNKVDKIIINRNAADRFGQKAEDIVGNKISIGTKVWTIIGVIENFHQQSLHNPTEPMLLTPDYDTFNPTSIKLDGKNYQSSLDQIKAAFEKSFPDNAFKYYFLEDRFSAQYKDDQRFSTVINIFTFLAIIISCLGLMGLSAYTAVQRTKEIAIRKVLGASVTTIVSILCIEFLRLVLLASLLSFPLAYFGINEWLSRYVYRITPGVGLYVLPILVVVIVAVVTICGQVINAAKVNPVNSLKSD